jgi:hypothetical protein
MDTNRIRIAPFNLRLAGEVTSIPSTNMTTPAKRLDAKNKAASTPKGRKLPMGTTSGPAWVPPMCGPSVEVEQIALHILIERFR